MKRALFALALISACGDGQDIVVPEEQEVRVAKLDGPCAAEIDHGLDGTIDEQISYTRTGLQEVERTESTDPVTGEKSVDIGTFDYDRAGRLLRMRYELDGETNMDWTWGYDGDGRQLRFVIDDGDGVAESIEIVTAWTAAGRNASSMTTRPNGQNNTTAWTYDALDRRLTRISTNTDGSERSRTTYVYDDAARTRLQTYVGNVSYRQLATYDAKGLIVREDLTFNDGSKAVSTFKYDKKGRPLEDRLIDDDPSQSFVIRYRYCK